MSETEIDGDKAVVLQHPELEGDESFQTTYAAYRDVYRAKGWVLDTDEVVQEESPEIVPQNDEQRQALAESKAEQANRVAAEAEASRQASSKVAVEANPKGDQE